MKNSLEKIKTLFAHQKVCIAYLTAGDGGAERTINAALALIEGGVHLLELGIPFSDPIADGSVIQQGTVRALQGGTHLKQVLEIMQALRKKTDIPLILFSYYNRILAASTSFDFFKEASEAGADGLLIVDCPFEESYAGKQKCGEHQLAFIHVVTPSTSMERLAIINKHAQGFLYYACRKGTTGVRSGLPDDFSQKIAALKSETSLPVVVGFGISDHATAQQVLGAVDGVVVGSLFVKALAEGADAKKLTALAKTIFTSTNVPLVETVEELRSLENQRRHHLKIISNLKSQQDN